jgi:hypothetical protein
MCKHTYCHRCRVLQHMLTAAVQANTSHLTQQAHCQCVYLCHDADQVLFLGESPCCVTADCNYLNHILMWHLLCTQQLQASGASVFQVCNGVFVSYCCVQCAQSSDVVPIAHAQALCSYLDHGAGLMHKTTCAACVVCEYESCVDALKPCKSCRSVH